MSLTTFIEPKAKVVTNVIVTAVQAAFGVWAAAGFSTDKLVIGGSVGAGLSVLWNVAVKPYLTQQGWLKG